MLRLPYLPGIVRREPKSLREQIGRLSREVEKLEGALASLVANEHSDPGYLSLQRLRTSLVQTELAQKRELLVAARARAATLNIPPVAEEKHDSPRPRKPAFRVMPVAPTLRTAHGQIFALVVLVSVLSVGFLVGQPLSRVFSSPPDSTPANAGVQTWVELAPAMNEPVGQRGEQFFVREMRFEYSVGDRVIVSGDPFPTGQFSVDDRMEMMVVRPDGTTVTWSRAFNLSCFANVPTPAEEVTELFLPGVNTVSIALYDNCGSRKGTSGPIGLSRQQGPRG